MSHGRARFALAGLLVAATASTAGPAAAAPPAVTLPAATPGADTTVTLLTGDVVTLGGPNGFDVVAAKGREHLDFRTYTDIDGDLNVVPEDALTGVSSGKLDPRLFDVSELARSGYGDADRKDLPVIVDYPGATPRAAGARVERELPAMSAVAMRAEKTTTFWETTRDSARKIWLDGPVKATLDRSVPQIGAPSAWNAGHTGEGTTVAVLDTGIDATHPDLDDAVIGAQDFTDSATGTDDYFGHGTHVASIITGDGAKNKGVAPNTKLLNGKVLDDAGGGYESWIIAGMEWAAASGADVVNMSLGTREASDGADPMSQAVNQITAETGTLFVIAAGNAGPGDRTVASPGAADAALTVGAVDRNDGLAHFSSRGPRLGDGAIKPDITAPGVDIVAAKAANGWIGNPADDGYVSLSGTSMATPHVAGAAAILAGQHPDWPADRLKSTLMASSKANTELSAYEQGAGRVDVAAAVDANVFASPASLSYGLVLYPHDDDEPITKTLTYTNSGSSPVTLDVAAEAAGAPVGMFTVSPAQITVPAGGTADVRVTADTRDVEGSFSGAVVATGGGAGVRTPIAVDSEVETFDVKLTFLDRAGKPTPDYGFRIVDTANPKLYTSYDVSGTTVVRVPKGTYFFDGFVTEGADRPWKADFTEPAFVVDRGHTEYTFDARDGRPLGFTVDKREAAPFRTAHSYRMTTDWDTIGSGWVSQSFDNIVTRPSLTAAPGDFEFAMEAQLAKPDGTGVEPGFHASPYLYNLRDVSDGAVPANPKKVIHDRQLAKVISSYAVATGGKIGVREGVVTMPLPYTMTEYYSPGTEWRPYFDEATTWDPVSRNGMHLNVFTPRSYELGRTTHERWNVGVIGPGLAYNPAPDEQGGYISRAGDDLMFLLNMHGDQNADVDGNFTNEEGYQVGASALLRDGEVIAENPGPGSMFARLSPEEATYALRTTATMTGPLSTRIDAEWTFRSARTGTKTPIPVLAVRFAPNLDNHNAAPAGKKFRFPVYVQRNGVQQVGQVNTPAVEISYDDGATWQKVRLSSHNGQWMAEVNHPRGAQYASLRWSVSDNAGNTAKATVIHAYALKK
ncbi:S8 family serine peptidase [Actinophytocola sp.]|uniref:S8 family peptidase n=1 Tax=Actinophytocola sp. TaxID=1872138 RepID=UPI002ED55F9F